MLTKFFWWWHKITLCAKFQKLCAKLHVLGDQLVYHSRCTGGRWLDTGVRPLCIYKTKVPHEWKQLTGRCHVGVEHMMIDGPYGGCGLDLGKYKTVLLLPAGQAWHSHLGYWMISLKGLYDTSMGVVSIRGMSHLSRPFIPWVSKSCISIFLRILSMS